MTPALFAYDPAPAEVYGPADLTPADIAERLQARRAALVAAFALAPTRPSLNPPLWPMSEEAGAVALAIARGACDVAAMIRGKGPKARRMGAF